MTCDSGSLVGSFLGTDDEPAGGPVGLVVGDADYLSEILAFTLAPAETARTADAIKCVLAETSMARSGSPDADAWGDCWVDRLIANQGVNHGNETTMQFSAVTASTRHDAYSEVSFARFTGLVAGTGASTLEFNVDWPNVALNPNATVQLDFLVSASRPFVESTCNASNRARFSSSAPFTQRTFVATQNGTRRTHSVTLTTAEVDAILGNWLLLQWTVPDLTLGDPFGVHSRESVPAPQRVEFSVSMAS